MVKISKVILIIGIVLLLSCLAEMLNGRWFNLPTTTFLNLIWLGTGLTSLGGIMFAWFDEKKLSK